MGASFGVAIFGAILNNRLSFYLPRFVPARAAKGIDPRSLVASPADIRKLPAVVQHGVIESFSRSIHVTFLWGLPLLVVAFAVTFLLRENPLRETAFITVPVEGLPVEAAESEVVGAGPALVGHALADEARPPVLTPAPPGAPSR
jgi:hypothetical protein